MLNSTSFAVFASGSQLLAGQISLAALSDNKLCLMLYTGIFAVPTLLLSFPRTLDQLGWMCIPSCISILVAGVVGMAAAGAFPVPAADRQIAVTVTTSFYTAFIAITNPVFVSSSTLASFLWGCLPPRTLLEYIVQRYSSRSSGSQQHTYAASKKSSCSRYFDLEVSANENPQAYAGHFMFFILISEMKRPQDAMKAAYTLQIFATAFYVAFAVVMYIYLGPTVLSPAFSSLPPKWAKAAYGIAIPNFLIAGSLYAHTAAKLFFIRFFRNSKHLHEHTVLGWGVWTLLIVVMNGAAFVLAVGVPIFSYLVGLAASLFASWYTYGIAGAFWLHDTYVDKGGWNGLKRRPTMTTLNTATFIGGAFICVAGTYVTIKLIIEAYQSGTVSAPFAC